MRESASACVISISAMHSPHPPPILARFGKDNEKVRIAGMQMGTGRISHREGLDGRTASAAFPSYPTGRFVLS